MTDLQITAEQCREALVRAALHEWERVVECRRNADRITTYFRDIGWQWHLDQHSDGVYDEDVRRGTINLEYCGIYVGWLGLQVGNHLVDGQCLPIRLRPEIAYYVLPSTARLASVGKWAEAGVSSPGRVEPEDAQRGDFVTVVTGRNQTIGDHYATVVERDGDTLHTIEANASGTLGDGTQGRGVVRRTRRIADVRRVGRLELRHFENALTGEALQEVSRA